MKLFRYRGKRIRPADRDLVFRSACCVVLPVFLAAFALLNLKTILQTDWRRLFMLGVGGFGWHMPYLLLSSIVSAAVAGTVLVLLYRLFPDVVRQLMHRQKLARMVLENQWYEQAERTKQDGFFKDLPSPDTKTKIARFPRMYYRMENGLLHFQVEITMGKYQEPLLHLETKLESGLYCELVSRELRDGYVEYTLLYDMVANRIPIAEAKAEGGRLRLMKNVWWEYDTLPHMLIRPRARSTRRKPWAIWSATRCSKIKRPSPAVLHRRYGRRQDVFHPDDHPGAFTDRCCAAYFRPEKC